MHLSSPVFIYGEMIPKKYGRDFENINPPLVIEDVPEGAKSFVLIMEDPDVPEAAGVPIWDHWVMFNIPPDIREISEAWIPTGVRGGTRGELEYGGPRPPDREHGKVCSFRRDIKIPFLQKESFVNMRFFCFF